MKMPNITLVCAAIMPLLAGCASHSTALSPAGPSPASRIAAAAENSKGYLQVFSATEKSLPSASDDQVYFNLHSGYEINDATGKCVKFVANHASDLDEWPNQVTLPSGNYNLVAQSSAYGQVTVPIVVETGKTTIVHLDNNWSPPATALAD
ncbi:MAG: hypothetical protein P4N60_09500 [Verrucomicrobiae bacterium]|nr:hypothetical protein [Verrucomicrobiae bacterium]